MGGAPGRDRCVAQPRRFRHVIFVDSNVFMYAVGRSHPLREAARTFFEESNRGGTPLCTSAEVVQELLHAYLPVAKLRTFDSVISLLVGSGVEVWPAEEEDVTLARQLHDRYPSLTARDLCHLASCRRRGVREVKTFDQAFDAIAGPSRRRG